MQTCPNNGNKGCMFQNCVLESYKVNSREMLQPTHFTCPDQFEYEVLLVCHEDDDATHGKISSALNENNVTYFSTISNGHPGRTLFQNIEECLPRCRKVCVVCSKQLRENKVLMQLVEIISLRRRREDVISVVEDEEAFNLVHTNKVCMSCKTWCGNLVEEIRRDSTDGRVVLYFDSNERRTRSMCEIAVSAKLATCLKQSNLNFGNLNYVFHGVSFSPTDPVVEVSFNSFVENISHHQKGNIKEACEEFPTLVTKETRVKLIIENNVFRTPQENAQFFQEFAKLFNSVHDVRLTKDLWFMRMYTIDGPVQDESFLLQLHDSIIKEIGGSVLSEETPFRSDFEERHSRIESFKGKWDEEVLPSIEDMVNAGFYLDSINKLCWCYQCGCGSFIWPKNLDVLPWHAKCVPACSFIQKTCSEEFIKHAQTLDFEHEKFDRYEDVGERKTSFDHTFGRNTINREQFIENLAQAGFFYSGFHDIIQCFFCRRYISCVDMKENIRHIWALHAGLSPFCSHVTEMKGRDYVEDIQAAREPNNSDHAMTITCFLKIPGVDRPWHKGAMQP